MAAEPVTITVDGGTVSGLWNAAAEPHAAVAVAHGAGSGMHQPFLAAIAAALAERGVGVLRYQFPYMEAGKSRPDPPARAAATVLAATEQLAMLAPGLPLFAGGKSFGGRMTSTAASLAPLPGVRGLFFLGFPLHPPGRPSTERAAHLAATGLPLLFLQGTRDDFARLDLLRPVVAGLGRRATLRLYEDADHSFKVPKSASRTTPDVFRAIVDDLATWLGDIARAQRSG